MQQVQTAGAPRPRSFEFGWLDGKWYDSTLIVGVMLLAIASGALVLWRPELFWYVLLADLWLLGYHHVIATFTKLAGTAEDRKENAFLIYVLPFIVLAGVYALYLGVGLWAIVTVYFFWQWFHYTRQAYGIEVFYRRKATFPTQQSQLLTHLAIWSIPVWGVLNRSAQGWEEFLFLPVWLPAVPERLAFVAGIIALAVTVWWVIARIKDYQQGRLSIAQTGFVASHMVVFMVGYIAIKDINVGWLVANVWHNAQYILFVWLYNTKRFGREIEPSAGKPFAVMHYISQRQPLRVMCYFAFTLLMTTIFYQSVNAGLQWIAAGNMVLLSTLYVVGYQTINFHHYVVDGLIWKARKKKHREVLQVS